ncbi:MAG: peptidase S1, partial [Acidobacteriota bacterium]
MKSFFERWRPRRLVSVYVLLGVLSAAILGASFAAHGVHGQEAQGSSADAAPLKIVNSPIQPNDFTRIAKLVGPAVVNINTQTLPKQSQTRRFHGHALPMPQSPDGGDDGDQGQAQGQGQGDDGFQDFFNRFF